MKEKKILLVDDSQIHVSALKELIETKDIKCVTAGNARETLDIVKNQKIDLLVIDLGLPDADGMDVIKAIRGEDYKQNLPVIIYTGRKLTAAEENEYSKFAEAIVYKNIGSYQQLKNAINHLLGRKPSLKKPEKKPVDTKHFKGKKVLIVDDDKRNIYSLSSVLKEFDMKILTADNGKNALEILDSPNHVDVILMDMMMPVMNGFEAIQKIRQNEKWTNLPIIAVTAKAMVGDREKCLEAGASDYLSKPVDIQKLISLLSIWLYEKPNLFTL